MLDARIRPLMDPTLTRIGAFLVKCHISANLMTVIGFAFGLLAIWHITQGDTILGGIFFLINRLCDGLDGGIARSSKMTDFGGYLDIMSDFIIYPAIPLAFCFMTHDLSPYAALLIFAMGGAMTSFLSFAILCAKNNIKTDKRGKKSFYYLGGICEGFETTLFLSILCFFSQYFIEISLTFTVLCFFTTLGRILQAKETFKIYS